MRRYQCQVPQGDLVGCYVWAEKTEGEDVPEKGDQYDWQTFNERFDYYELGVCNRRSLPQYLPWRKSTMWHVKVNLMTTGIAHRYQSALAIPAYLDPPQYFQENVMCHQQDAIGTICH